MKENWTKSFKAVLRDEGGDVDDPDDHGGRTSRGITQATYNAWCREKGFPRIDVYKAPMEHVEVIYREEYWGSLGDLLPTGVDYMYFDMAVNAGPSRSAKLLQRALGVAEDGRIGPITRAAITEKDPEWLIARFTSVKEAFYRGLHQPKFLRGWLNRNARVRATAMAMIGGK